VFQIEMLPAAHGDCLWIEYGTGNKVHRILIDGGPAPAYDALRSRILRLPSGKRRFDLLVVTHVDADHLEGIVVLMQDPALGLEFDDVWFNGWDHLPSDLLGPAQAEMLSGILKKRRPWGHKLPWNRLFGGGPVQVPDDPSQPLPVRQLAGGMTLTLLAPTRHELARLAPYWRNEVLAAELTPGGNEQALELLDRSPRLRRRDILGAFDVEGAAAKVFRADTTRANGSSIVLLAEFGEAKALLAGDAHAAVLLKTIPRLLAARPGLTLDAFKLPHHGSKKNVSLPLVQSIPARKYLFSTNGAQFKHPDPEAVSRVLVGNGAHKELWFNYRTVYNELWRDKELVSAFDAVSRYPDPDGPGMGVTVAL
jgi:beta-lactamase superfamily II metal-dependent hydrolase